MVFKKESYSDLANRLPEHIYLYIYIYTLHLSLPLYIYIHMRICLCIPYVYTHTLCHLGFLGIKMWFILLRPRPPPEAAEDVLHFLQEDLLDAGLVEASRKWLPKGRVLQPVLQHPP